MEGRIYSLTTMKLDSWMLRWYGNERRKEGGRELFYSVHHERKKKGQTVPWSGKLMSITLWKKRLKAGVRQQTTTEPIEETLEEKTFVTIYQGSVWERNTQIKVAGNDWRESNTTNDVRKYAVVDWSESIRHLHGTTSQAMGILQTSPNRAQNRPLVW